MVPIEQPDSSERRLLNFIMGNWNRHYGKMAEFKKRIAALGWRHERVNMKLIDKYNHTISSNETILIEQNIEGEIRQVKHETCVQGMEEELIAYRSDERFVEDLTPVQLKDVPKEKITRLHE